MYTMRSNTFILFFLSLAFSFLMFNCADDNSSEQISAKEIKVYMTDCPFDAEEVNVEIWNVRLEHDDGESTYLNTASGVYNLLDFQNGVDFLLASGLAAVSDLKNIYFELGQNNTIVIDGETFPLVLQGDNEVKVKFELGNILGDMEFLVEFYACNSIIESNGEYFLKPVIKFKGERKDGQGNGDIDLADVLEFFEDCYTLVYPIQIEDFDGNILPANDKEELNEILVNNDDLNLIYPITLEDRDGVQLSIAREQELEDLAVDCFEDNSETALEQLLARLRECYEIVYPISFTDEAGETYTVQNEAELMMLIDQVEIEDVVLPADLLDENGETIHVETYEGLIALIIACN